MNIKLRFKVLRSFPENDFCEFRMHCQQQGSTLTLYKHHATTCRIDASWLIFFTLFIVTRLLLPAE